MADIPPYLHVKILQAAMPAAYGTSPPLYLFLQIGMVYRIPLALLPCLSKMPCVRRPSKTLHRRPVSQSHLPTQCPYLSASVQTDQPDMALAPPSSQAQATFAPACPCAKIPRSCPSLRFQEQPHNRWSADEYANDSIALQVDPAVGGGFWLQT